MITKAAGAVNRHPPRRFPASSR